MVRDILRGILHDGRRKPNGLGCDGYEPLGTLERGMEWRGKKNWELGKDACKNL